MYYGWAGQHMPLFGVQQVVPLPHPRVPPPGAVSQMQSHAPSTAGWKGPGQEKWATHTACVPTTVAVVQPSTAIGKTSKLKSKCAVAMCAAMAVSSSRLTSPDGRPGGGAEPYSVGVCSAQVPRLESGVCCGRVTHYYAVGSPCPQCPVQACLSVVHHPHYG